MKHALVNGFVAIILMVGLFSTTAFAGFQWAPRQKAEYKMPLKAQPLPKVEMMELSPIALVPSPSPMQALEPMEAPTSIVVPSHVVTEVKSTPKPKIYSEVVGFGRDIPLVLALRQIVPSDYAFSFDKGVSPAILVDWSGGKPWDQVISDALETHDMMVVVVDKTVWIRKIEETDKKKVTKDILSKKEGTKIVSIAPGKPLFLDPLALVNLPIKTSVKVTGKSVAPDVSSEPMPIEPIAVMEAERRYLSVQASEIRRDVVPLVNAMMKAPHQGFQNVSGSPFWQSTKKLNEYEPAANKSSGEVSEPEGLNAQIPVNAGAAPFEIFFWQVEKGASLKETLFVWAQQANVRLLWGTGSDYKLVESVSMHGTFVDVVKTVLASYGLETERPVGELHPNMPTGPAVLLIKSYGQS